MALSIGFMSPMRTTPASEELKENLNKIIEKIGEFPHDKMDVSNIKKQGTRNKKVACLSCDFSFRTSQKNIDNMVILDCPACEEEDALIVV
jgi:transposase